MFNIQQINNWIELVIKLSKIIAPTTTMDNFNVEKGRGRGGEGGGGVEGGGLGEEQEGEEKKKKKKDN